MNTREYIESGNLEAFVLGVLTPQEEAQVRADIAANPELANEVASIEAAMFNYAVAQSVTPPLALENQIWDAIQAQEKEQHIPELNITAAPVSTPVNGGGDTIHLENKSIPFTPASKNTTWRYAAVWVALLGSVALNAVLSYQNNQQKEQFATASTKINEKMGQLIAEQRSMAQVLDIYRKRSDMMADTGMQTVVMHTVVKGHPMAATVYWSKSSGAAYVMLDALPQPPKGMQYQLWVMQDGKPVDMGVLPLDMTATASIQKVEKPVMNGQGFAISLEKMGGSPSPTMENIYVMGKS